MASKAFALFLAVNLVALIGVASACGGRRPSCPTPTPTPTPSTPTPTPALIKAKVGVPPAEPCCPLLEGLGDLEAAGEAAVCLCTAIRGNILGINLNLPIDLSLILNYCGKAVPTGFKC
uniref:Hydrophobic seed protein domain-containing protein n=1 Tax=Oryza brachyantha TaxID=4533 RepID=J3LFJ1_ORYBR